MNMNKREFIGAIGASCLLPALPAFGQESEEFGVMGEEIDVVTNEEMAKLVCAHSCMVKCITSGGGCLYEWNKYEGRDKGKERDSRNTYLHPEYSWQTCSGVIYPVDHVFTNKLPEKHNKIRRRLKYSSGSYVTVVISDDGELSMFEILNLSHTNLRIIELTTNNNFDDDPPSNPRYFGRLLHAWVELGV